jgi:hypothetical protein
MTCSRGVDNIVNQNLEILGSDSLLVSNGADATILTSDSERRTLE